jgi:hypothetical protein
MKYLEHCDFKEILVRLILCGVYLRKYLKILAINTN